MEDQRIDLTVSIQTQQAEQGLDKIINKAGEAKKELKDLNDKSKEGIPAIKDLGQSFETALGKADGNMRGLVSSTSNFIKSVKNIIPAFKAARVAGNSLWKSIKIGIASTGIGLLVVALGEVIGNWEKWSSTIQGWLPWVKRGQEETDKFTQANENLIKANTEQNKLIEHQARLMKAAGAEEKDIIKYKIQETQALQANTQAQINETQSKIDAIRAHTAFGRWVRGENKDLKKLEESLKSLEAENKKQQDNLQSLTWSLEETEVSSQHKRTESAKKGSKDRIESFKAELEYLKGYAGDVTAIMETISRDLDKIQPKTRNWFKELLKPEHPRESSEKVLKYLEKAFADINTVTSKKYQKTIEDTQNKLNEASKQGKKDVVNNLTKELEDLKKEFEGGKWKLNITEEIFTGLLEGDAQEYANELQELISQRHLLFATGRTTLSEDLKKEEELQLKAYGQEEHLLAKRLKYIKKYLGESSAEYKDLDSQRVALVDERETFIREQAREIAKAVLEEQLGTIDAAQETLQDTGDRWAGLNGGLVGKGMADIYKQQQQAQADYYASMRDSYDVGTAEYEAYAEKYKEITDRINGFDGKRTQFVFQQINQQYKYWNDLVSSVGSLFGSLASYYEEDIKARRERNEIGEEEAEQEFERVKKLQLAEVWMNTLAGAIGAFLQASAAYPAPWGQILGAATAATVLASGVAQHTKIKNTQFGGGATGGGGSGVPNVAVTPIDVRDDIQASPTTLPQSQSPTDQRVYILEGDIQDSNKRVEIREANSTF